MLVIMAGLPGTGKSTLCRALVEKDGGAVLNKDLIRAALFEPGRVTYTSAQDDLVQDLMLRTAEWLLQADPELRVYFDGRTFSRGYQLVNAIEAAGRMRTPWIIIECICNPETARARIASDLAAGTHPAKNRDLSLYQRLQSQFEPITLDKIVIDTDRPLAECVTQALDALSAASKRAPHRPL